MGDPLKTRASVAGRIGRTLYPDLDRELWRRRRRRQIKVDLASADYVDIQERRPVISVARVDRPPHVVVVPQEGEEFDSFRPAGYNYYYEAAQVLREIPDGPEVSVFHVGKDERPAQWHSRLLDFLIDVGATHVMVHSESDPGEPGTSFTWDTWWTLASHRWDGVFLGVAFDAAYDWITAGQRQLARINQRFVLVDICMPAEGVLVRRRPEVGPVTMPISQETLALLDERLADVTFEYDVSFIGALYPYRQELIERLRAAGVRVAVNPHREGGTADLADSRRNLPSWLDYMAALRSSHMTINFSQSSAGPFEQLKWRVQEATAVGTLLLTDDRDRTRLFWAPDEYAYFSSPEALPSVVDGLLADPERMERIRAAGFARGREWAGKGLWWPVDAGLRRRGLRPVLTETG